MIRNPDWRFLEHVEHFDTSFKGVNNPITSQLGTVRKLLNKALSVVLEDKRFDAVDAIMEFSEVHKLTLRFRLVDLEELIRAEAYPTLIQMVEAEI